VIDDEDRAFIASKCLPRVQASIPKPRKLRFERSDRVVCMIGGERGWAAGTIAALDQKSGPGAPSVPYVVKLDPPLSRLVSVPADEYTVCCAEVCFGRLAKRDIKFSLRCKPTHAGTTDRRFQKGDRVCCAVEDCSMEYSDWAAGTVVDVDVDVSKECKELEIDWDLSKEGGIMPYRVLLDGPAGEGGDEGGGAGGGTGGGAGSGAGSGDGADSSGAAGSAGGQQQQPVYVIVHNDAHWLIRDRALQSPGPRQSEDGRRSLKRITKRRRDRATWELIDQATRNVRTQAATASDDEDEEDDKSAAGGGDGDGGDSSSSSNKRVKR
jgi:hypothetical protein